MRVLDIEIAVARMFGIRRNIIVPNVSWGAGFAYELDMLVISQSGYATEIEIKTSYSDFMADFKKHHYHDSYKIKRFYYALPDDIYEKCKDKVPEKAGIIIVNRGYQKGKYCGAYIKKLAVIRNDYKLSDYEISNIMRLGVMRIWALKQTLRNIRKEKSGEDDK